MTEAAGRPQGRITIWHLLLLAPWVAVAAGAWKAITDNSFLWHVRAGTLQMGTGQVLVEDPFSFTMAGESWLTQSWLVELLYGWLEGGSGLGFVPLMLVVLGLLTFATIGCVAYRDSASVPATATVLLLTLFALLTFLVPRPVLFSYLLMALVVLAWARPSTRWALPFLFWMWAASHGSFVIGLAYLGIMLLLEREWRWLPTAVASGLVTLATAHGLSVVQFLVGFGANREALDSLTEWRRPGLDDPAFLALLAIVVLIVVGLIRNQFGMSRLLLVVPFLFLGTTSLRAIPPVFIGLVPLAAQSLRGVRFPLQRGLSPVPAGVLAVAIVALPLFLIGDAGLSEQRFPIVASDELEDVRTFHDDVVGGYLIWAQWPETLVYVDDRAELYGDRLGELVAVRRGELDWEPIFERDGVQQALLAAEEPLAADLVAAGWTVDYEDDNFVVLTP